MGRKTYESIGKPLPNRITVIISRNLDYQAEGCIITNSIENALEIAKDDSNAFLIGGANIYNKAINLVDELDICEIHHSFDADAYFPEIDTTIWKETDRTKHLADEKNKYSYSFIRYKRK